MESAQMSKGAAPLVADSIDRSSANTTGVRIAHDDGVLDPNNARGQGAIVDHATVLADAGEIVATDRNTETFVAPRSLLAVAVSTVAPTVSIGAAFCDTPLSGTASLFESDDVVAPEPACVQGSDERSPKQVMGQNGPQAPCAKRSSVEIGRVRQNTATEPSVGSDICNRGGVNDGDDADGVRREGSAPFGAIAHTGGQGTVRLLLCDVMPIARSRDCGVQGGDEREHGNAEHMASPFAADRNLHAARHDPDRLHMTLGEFVALLDALPDGAKIDTGVGGVRFARHVFRLEAIDYHDHKTSSKATFTWAPELGALHTDNLHTTDRNPMGYDARLDQAVDMDAVKRANHVDLIGKGAVPAHTVARLLRPCADAHADWTVAIGGHFVARADAPVPKTQVGLVWRDSLPQDALCSIVGREASAALARAVCDARDGVRDSALLARLCDGLPRDVPVSICLYRIGSTLFTAAELAHRYPLLDAQVRDALFNCVRPDGPPPAVADCDRRCQLWSTLAEQSVIGLAYCAPENRLLAAFTYQVDLLRRSPARDDHHLYSSRDRAALSPGGGIVDDAVRRALVVGTLNTNVSMTEVKACDVRGMGALVVMTAEGCRFCGAMMPALHEAAARLTVPALVVPRDQIPASERPMGYPHTCIVGGPLNALPFQGDRTADNLVDYVRHHLGDAAIVH